MCTARGPDAEKHALRVSEHKDMNTASHIGGVLALIVQHGKAERLIKISSCIRVLRRGFLRTALKITRVFQRELTGGYNRWITRRDEPDVTTRVSIEKATKNWHYELTCGETGKEAQYRPGVSPGNLFSLGVSYNSRFRHLGNLKDIEKAIEYLSRALNSTPDGHPDLPGRLDSLGVSYNDRFQRLGDLKDLERDIEYSSRALDSTPDGHPDLPGRLDSLGVSYNDRFQRLGDLKDIEKAIEYKSRALNSTPDGHPDLPGRLYSLGVSYNDRFQRLGDLKDLERDIEYSSRALDSTPDGHPDLPSRLDSLGVSYNDRFQRLGDLKDLERDIEYSSRALDLTPDGHPDFPRRLYSLGVSYNDRFQRLGDLKDIEKAIEYKSRALDSTPDGHPDFPRRLYSLGVSYNIRFQRLGDLKDIEKAIEYKSRALDSTPDGHPDLPRRLDSLGVSYNDRFQRLGDLKDLERDIEYSSSALDLTPDGHPNLSRRHFHLAISCLLRYRHTNQLSDLGHSLASFQKSSQLSTGPPRDTFQYALTWAQHASIYPALSCMEAYQAAIEALPQFIWLGASTKQRYEDLSTVENLAINASSAAIRHSNYTLALEWIEHARCVVWNQNLMLRSPLDQLKSCNPHLAVRLEAISHQLQDISYESPGPLPGLITQEQEGRQRRHLALEYNSLLSETRKLPGFENFLQPMKSVGLIRAARFGPVVIINCHKDGCDALITMPRQGEIKHLALPGFTTQKARNAVSDLEESLRRKGLRQRGVKVKDQSVFKDPIPGVLLDLWIAIVKPVLQFLDFMNEVSIDSLPHITWCPTGALSFLPLHAAGDYTQPRTRVFDYAISSYTPTLSALLASTPNLLPAPSRVLVIGQAETPGHAPLPGTTQELTCLKDHMKSKVEYTELIDNQATRAAVLDAMEEHDWVHLACHAHQNVQDPTKSGFFLHDGILDLASISQRSFRNKGLAFLSACQTATGDEKLPDEAIHLASGMLMAGYPSVIATMWSVVDADAPFVADKVYGQLMEDGKLGNGAAGKALHHAVAELRDKVGEQAFGRWVPYIHIGS
ncbi:hypothetical protein OPQ81_003810 [Rhizoctonia solani]|nr:hypothetical protein OPQ81_003810 [Rhizoctonia solani]